MHALRVLQVAGVVIGDPQSSADGAAPAAPSSHRISEMSLHFAEKAAARAAQAGSSRSR